MFYKICTVRRSACTVHVLMHNNTVSSHVVYVHDVIKENYWGIVLFT